MIPILYFSHRLDALLDAFIQELDAQPIPPLETRTILVPHSQMKQWLLLELAKRKGIAMGLKVMEIGQYFKPSLSPLEMYCLLYQELVANQEPILKTYLNGKNRRFLELTEQLTTLFLQYGQFGKHLFEEKPTGWQQELLQKLFVQGPYRLPIQSNLPVKEPIWCFGIDSTPFWPLLFQSPKLSLFLFSPCVDFWEDICTDWERKKLNRYWKKRGSSKTNRDQLDTYLREAPPILANWGKLGRETLKAFDSYDLEVVEVYPPLEANSLLTKIQNDLLHFQITEKSTPDDSIKVVLTGSSPLKEIECLREEILRLRCPYHEIAVLAPDIEPYIPLIEFVFGNDIPYRISGCDVASQSSFRQGLMRLIRLSSSRWEAEDILTLFETPAFYRKQTWDQRKLELYKKWIESAHIQWGIDQTHRTNILADTLGDQEFEDRGSWEKGLDALLDALIFLKPIQINPDEFEEFLTVISALQELPLKGEKTLADWADCLEETASRFLCVDFTEEADVAAQNSFRQFLTELRKISEKRLYPITVIQHLLDRSCRQQIHAAHLHAVRFSSIDEGALLPARALFLIGMDEENFPRLKTASSLDLLKGQVLNQSDRDRYLFLQALFSAQEYVRISYGHLSPDEGKPIGPSLLVQELLSTIGSDISTIYQSKQSLHSPKQHSVWPKIPIASFPEGNEVTISILELKKLVRHPWKFYLQKAHGIYLDEPLEETFHLQKGQLLRALLEKSKDEVLTTENLPPGLLGEAMKLEIMEKADEWEKQLVQWEVKPFTLVFRESCRQLQWEEGVCIVPALELDFGTCKVRIVGEVNQTTTKGLICTYDDKIEGLLKSWPEALVVGLALNASQILVLKNGKAKPIQDLESQLKALIEYYFTCLTAPSPLLPIWADALLRKEESDFLKTFEKQPQFEDPILEWVLSRTEFSAEEIVQQWSPYLKKTFCGLIDLYPSRGKRNAAV